MKDISAAQELRLQSQIDGIAFKGGRKTQKKTNKQTQAWLAV